MRDGNDVKIKESYNIYKRKKESKLKKKEKKKKQIKRKMAHKYR